MSHQNLLRVWAPTLRRSLTLSLALMTLAGASARGASPEAIDDTFPASVNVGGVFANSGTEETQEDPSISSDGRYVAFRSAASNLGEHGAAGVYEAYVKDLQSGEVKLVSRANGASGEAANEPGEATGVEDVIISGDGRYVIFTSDASNLVSGLPPGEEPEEHPRHVYRRDLQTGETLLVDRASGPQGEILDERAPNGEAISADGRYVVFRDHVEDLEDPSSGHELGLSTVYVRDMQSPSTVAVSRASGSNGELANARSLASSISANGRYVAFESSATDLVAGMQANTVSQVYLRDLQSDTTTLLSRTPPTQGAPAGEPGNEASSTPVLLGEDGCEVAFTSAASNLYLYAGRPLESPEVYLTDLCATPASTALVSRASGLDGAPAAEGNAAIPTPLGASADGRYVLFSALPTLTGESSNTRSHLYVRDLFTEITTLIDRASTAEGTPANGDPEGGAISANGCRVVFETQASNLVEPPLQITRKETYIRQLSPCDREPTIAPASVSFAAQALDTIGAGRLITVTAGSEALQLGSVKPSGAAAGDFVVTADECSGETLQPGGSCSLMVRFAPSAVGTLSTSLVVNHAGAVPLTVTLIGEGAAAAGEDPSAPGPAGKEGAPGDAGRTGANGASGLSVPGWPATRARCHLGRRHRTLLCSVSFRGMSVRSRTQARLTKGALSYARGQLGGLRATRAIRSGTYTLRLSVQGHILAIPVRLN
jgi:Tol biopolymer transport system component